MMQATQYTPAEVGRLGREIYDRDIRPKVEKDNVGKFIAIDILSGDYEIDDDEIAVLKRTSARQPRGEWLIL